MEVKNLKEVVSLLPENTQFQLACDAAREQNIQWLKALDEVGIYNIPLDSELQYDPRAKFSPFEWPAIASLCEVINEDNIKGYRLNIKSEFLIFFQKIVIKFLDELDFRIAQCKEIQEYSQMQNIQISGHATSGVLLSAACAMNDAVTVREIVKRYKISMVMTCSPLLMLADEISNRVLITPSACALRFGSIRAMEVLIDFGLKASSPIAYDLDKKDDQYKKNGPYAVSASAKSINTLQWMTREIERLEHGREYNSFIDVFIEKMYYTANKELVRSGFLIFCAAVIAKKRTDVNERNPILLTMDRLGILDINPNGFSSVACVNANYYAMDILFNRVDWAKIELGNELSMKEFPPSAIANSKFWDKSIEELESVVTKWCQSCIKSGHGKFLAKNGEHSPARIFAERDLVRPLVLALEEGADPTEKLNDGRTLLDLVLNNSRSAHIVRSFMTTKAAMEAMSSLGHLDSH